MPEPVSVVIVSIPGDASEISIISARAPFRSSAALLNSFLQSWVFPAFFRRGAAAHCWRQTPAPQAHHCESSSQVGIAPAYNSHFAIHNSAGGASFTANKKKTDSSFSRISEDKNRARLEQYLKEKPVSFPVLLDPDS